MWWFGRLHRGINDVAIQLLVIAILNETLTTKIGHYLSINSIHVIGRKKHNWASHKNTHLIHVHVCTHTFIAVIVHIPKAGERAPKPPPGHEALKDDGSRRQGGVLGKQKSPKYEFTHHTCTQVILTHVYIICKCMIS